MADTLTPRRFVPSRELLLPLPQASRHLVCLIRDWMPPDRLSSNMIGALMVDAAGVIHRIRDARVEIAVGPGATRVSGWPRPELVHESLNRLAAAIKTLLDYMDWTDLWVQHSATAPAAPPPTDDPRGRFAGTGLNISWTPPPPTETLLAAVEHAARLMEQALMASVVSGNPASVEMTGTDAPGHANQAAGASRPPPRPGANEYMSPTDLANHYGVGKSSLEARLRRWRNSHKAESGRGWTEVPDRGPRQPKYLYHTLTVINIVTDLRASGERRAKK